MIEVSDKKYWKQMNYYDGLLYVSLLDIDGKNDWRLPKDADEIANMQGGIHINGVWYLEDAVEDNSIWSLEYDTFAIIPVRNI